VDAIEKGRLAFFLGDLHTYRIRLGLSKMALAEILGVVIGTLYRWEGFDMMAKLSDRNAEQVALFCIAAEKTLEDYPDFPERFMTLARFAQTMGMTQEFALDLIRAGRVPATDFGMLGLFIQRGMVTALKQDKTLCAL